MQIFMSEFINVIVDASVAFFEIHIARLVIFERVCPFEKPGKTDVDSDDSYRNIIDKNRLNIRDEVIINGVIVIWFSPKSLFVFDRGVIPVFRNRIGLDLFLCKRYVNELSAVIPGEINTFLAACNTGDIKRVMNICAPDKIVILGHKADKVNCIINDRIAKFGITGYRFHIRNLAPCPSGKRSNCIFGPQKLSV